MIMTSELAPAKINLFLHVVGRRDDGYHLLDSLAVFAGLADVLDHEPAETLSLAVTGPFAASLQAEPGNLVLRAARALAVKAGVTATGKLTLHKHIPVASGVGGGSADAAAALRLLTRVWGVRPDSAAGLATGLGADVPVCLRGRPARMGGIGEVLTEAPAMPACGVLLVNPGIPLATPDVFRARKPGFSARAALPERWDGAADMAAALADLRNDLEAPAIRLVPEIQSVLTAIAGLPGCKLARMSGSGATCFGLFPGPAEAERAAAVLAPARWWRWGGALAG